VSSASKYSICSRSRHWYLDECAASVSRAMGIARPQDDAAGPDASFSTWSALPTVLDRFCLPLLPIGGSGAVRDGSGVDDDDSSGPRLALNADRLP
jgi:hypothetical protein